MSLLSLSLALVAFASADTPAPSTGFQWTGGRGLSQTRSAEPLGSGVFLLSLRGATYPTDFPVAGLTPPAGAMVSSVMGAAGIGANNFIDFSAWSIYYSVSDWAQNPNAAGFGASGVTAKVAIPFDPSFPLRLAAQGGIIAGASTDQIHTGYDSIRLAAYPDAYSYFENRTGYDFEGRLLQTVRLVTPQVTVELHANEGVVTTLQAQHAPLVVIDGGLAVSPGSIVTLGVEGHLRTLALKPRPFTDPLWATLTAAFHIPRGPDITVGTDINAASGRADTRRVHSLEPWRAFLHVAMPFDLGMESRERARLAREQELKEKQELQNRADENERKAKELAERAAELDAKAQMLTEKARLDSIAAVEAGLSRDSYRRRADSLGVLSREDSLKRAAAEKALADERARSGNLEAALLNTGLLALDAVYFQNGKSQLTANSKPYLKMVGGILAKYPKLKLEIGGHTDNRGKALSNQKLSQARAASVRAYLVGQFPVLGGSLVAKGYGSTQPKEDNSTAEGREQNRRVEIKVRNPEILPELRAAP